jgi:hypothetical protein
MSESGAGRLAVAPNSMSVARARRAVTKAVREKAHEVETSQAELVAAKVRSPWIARAMAATACGIRPRPADLRVLGVSARDGLEV